MLRGSIILIYTMLVSQAVAFGQTAFAVSLDTTPLVGHPAGPFYFAVAVTDGSGVNDANNTITITNVSFGGGNSFGGPVRLGGATGSLESGITITDSSFLSWFFEPFAPGDTLSFTVTVTSNDDAGGIPDRLTFFILESSGVPLPTKSPAGDYFLGVDLSSTLPGIDLYGSDPLRPPTVGSPVSIPAPTIPLRSITIDIKPGDGTPTINLKSNGITPVAILSSTTFDAPNAVDRMSLRFGEIGNEQSLASCNPGGEDVNGDGLLDLVCRFTTLFTGFQSQDTTGVLKGKTLAGVLFQGTGAIVVVGK